MKKGHYGFVSPPVHLAPEIGYCPSPALEDLDYQVREQGLLLWAENPVHAVRPRALKIRVPV